MNDTIVIATLNDTDASFSGCSSIHLSDIPCKPPSTFGVAMLLDDIFAVKVVYANLLIYQSDHVLEIRGSNYLFSVLPADRCQWGERSSADDRLIVNVGPSV